VELFDPEVDDGDVSCVRILFAVIFVLAAAATGVCNELFDNFAPDTWLFRNPFGEESPTVLALVVAAFNTDAGGFLLT
jgi:uncharacterized membrane protein YphA (DoxX/SURF4 family)